MPVAGGLTGFFVSGMFGVGREVMVVGPHAVLVEASVVNEGRERAR